MSSPTFADVLGMDGVVEQCELRSTFGFMAYHGGGLEEMTDVIAGEAAARSGASYYGVLHPPNWDLHLPSTRIDPKHSPVMSAFLDHVDVVITVHGFGRHSLMTSLLLGGQNRALAATVAGFLRAALPAYDVLDDLEAIPKALRGVHDRNPVNLPVRRGVQVELPPRVRGSGPLWWDWEHGLTPHTEALIDALARTATATATPVATDLDR